MVSIPQLCTFSVPSESANILKCVCYYTLKLITVNTQSKDPLHITGWGGERGGTEGWFVNFNVTLSVIGGPPLADWVFSKILPKPFK